MASGARLRPPPSRGCSAFARQVDAFLDKGEQRLFMERVGDKLLELARQGTKEGLNAAKKDAGGGKEAKGKKGKGGKGGKGGGDGGDGVGSDSLLQIDFDVKMRVLSRSLRERKKASARPPAHRWPLPVRGPAATNSLPHPPSPQRRSQAFAAAISEQKQKLLELEEEKAVMLEMQKAKEMFMGGGGGGGGGGSGGGGGEEAPSATPDDAGPEASPPPRFKLLLSPEELLLLIKEAMLETADRIHKGLPIDAHLSVSKALRKAEKAEAA